MIDRVVVDYVKTFGKPGIFLSCEPKMVRENKDAANSKQVQGRDGNGSLKWTATIAMSVKVFDREKYENLSITLTSPSQPCAGIQPGQPVVIEGLEMGLMPGNKNPQFWSAAAIKPVQVQARQ
jgi:hypothetical protein